MGIAFLLPEFRQRIPQKTAVLNDSDIVFGKPAREIIGFAVVNTMRHQEVNFLAVWTATMIISAYD